MPFLAFINPCHNMRGMRSGKIGLESLAWIPVSFISFLCLFACFIGFFFVFLGIRDRAVHWVIFTMATFYPNY